MKCKIFIILGLAIALSACGQTGKLYLPKDQSQAQQKNQTDSQVQTQGNNVNQQPNQQSLPGSSPIS